MKDTSEHSEPPELVGPPASSNPFQNIQKALWEGFCAPGAEEDINKNETSAGPLTQDAVSTSPTDTLENLKKALRFCNPGEQKEVCDNSLVFTRSYDSDDNTLKTPVEDDDEAEEKGDNIVVVHTRPATSRLFRVVRGMETFVSFLAVLCLTVSILRWFDTNLGIEFCANTVSGESSPFLSITTRT